MVIRMDMVTIDWMVSRALHCQLRLGDDLVIAKCAENANDLLIDELATVLAEDEVQMVPGLARHAIVFENRNCQLVTQILEIFFGREPIVASMKETDALASDFAQIVSRSRRLSVQLLVLLASIIISHQLPGEVDLKEVR